MSTFTAKIQRAGSEAKFLQNAMNVNGYLVQKVGSATKLHFNGANLTATEKKYCAKSNLTIDKVIADNMAHVLVKFGTNGTLTVEQYEEPKAEVRKVKCCDCGMEFTPKNNQVDGLGYHCGC